MPLFDYQCPFCGHVREVLVKRADEPVYCYLCDESKLNGPEVKVAMAKLPAAPGFRMKGFSAVNGYNSTDTGYQPSQYAGIKTRVSDAEDK